MTVSQNPAAGALAPLARHFSQLGYVVTDLDAARTMFEQMGVTDFKTMEGGGDTYRNESGGVEVAASVRLAFGTLGKVQVEIIEPISAGNLYTDFLERSGPGLHHIGFLVPDLHDYRAHHRRLVDLGAILMKGRRIEGRFNVEFAYFDCSPFQGAVVELMHFF